VITSGPSLRVTRKGSRKVGAWVPLIALEGGALPFISAYLLYKSLEYGDSVALIVAVAFVTASVAITVRIMEELGYLETDMGALLVNLAALDDAVGVVFLGMASAALVSGKLDLVFAVKQAIVFIIIWLIILHIVIYVIPRLLKPETLSETEGAVGSIAISIGFIMSALSSAFGLSPIVGAYTAGLAVAESKVIARAEDFAQRMEMFFGSLFLAVVGAKVDISEP